jgi:RimJ/RimL family protein N-acetyltransferase
MKFKVPQQLESERLILRQFIDADWRDLHQYFSDPKAMTFTHGRGLSEGETWRTMSCMIGHWQLRGYGPYAVTAKTDGRVMGTVGFWYPNDWPSPEIKWGLACTYWGQGFAREAAQLVLETAWEYLPEVALISLINPENTGSLGVAQALGATLETTVDYEGLPHGIYRHKTSKQGNTA